MLVHEQQIRLTARECEVLFRLTGSNPHYVTTREELKAWVDRHLQNRPQDERRVRLLKMVLRRHLPL